MLFAMDAYLFPTLFCLVLCAAFVWLAVKRMRAGKPHRVFLWLARFFGVMVVMGVDSICKAEGIILGGLGRSCRGCDGTDDCLWSNQGAGRTEEG